jgi:hypothetical protein
MPGDPGSAEGTPTGTPAGSPGEGQQVVDLAMPAGQPGESAAAGSEDPTSPYFQHLDTARIGALGHSEGGASTSIAAADPRISAIATVCGSRALTGLHGRRAQRPHDPVGRRGVADELTRVAREQK